MLKNDAALKLEDTHHARVAEIPKIIAQGFIDFLAAFASITARGPARFVAQDWAGVHEDAVARLELDAECAHEVRKRLGDGTEIPASFWDKLRLCFLQEFEGTANIELAISFFNAVLQPQNDPTEGEHLGLFPLSQIDLALDEKEAPLRVVRVPRDPSDRGDAPLSLAIEHVLQETIHMAPWVDFDRDVQLLAQATQEHVHAKYPGAYIDAIEVLTPIFYRGRRAYLMGRVRHGVEIEPWVLPLVMQEDKLAVDACLMEQDAVSVLFSFARSYFHVALEVPRPAVAFLRSIMPLKRVAEIYISLGYPLHGKSELYRSLYAHLHNSSDLFVHPPGRPGMVMCVFSLPSYGMVFKVIRDQFKPPKVTSRKRVLDRYRLVFHHDRVGRLVDAQEVFDLKFRADRFAPEVLDELLVEAPSSVRLDDEGWLHIRHGYLERRVTPLDVFMAHASEDAAKRAMIDYGWAIRDLAAAHIFPGDLFLKNFGVTRHGRVVFYDYDELCLLSECRFRAFPAARCDWEDLFDEVWFSVAENDVFPEEFVRFLGLKPAWRHALESEHSAIFTAEYWQEMQGTATNVAVDVLPYRAARRL